MNKIIYVVFYAAALMLPGSCSPGAESASAGATQPADASCPGSVSSYYQALQVLTDVMVDDIFSPPLASRTYAYACLAAWEAYVAASDSIQRAALPAGSLAGILPGYAASAGLPAAAGNRARVAPPDRCRAALEAFYGMAAELVFQEEPLLEARQKALGSASGSNSGSAPGFAPGPAPDAAPGSASGLAPDAAPGSTPGSRRQNNPPQAGDATAVLVQDVLQRLRAYRDSDGYASTRGLPRYALRQQPGYWTTTPPGYFDPVEPHWGKLRPFLLDSADQYRPAPPSPWSMDPSSSFYRDMQEVYRITGSLSEEQRLIANFWDCNPFYLDFQGHFNTGIKKISPGAHWMGIAGIACRDAGLDFGATLWVHTALALGLADAFISCWDEKYRSEYIRPETAIQSTLDPSWEPLLQTPPFPEYTSGHSVASNAAATVLTALLGSRPFIDSVEIPYGLPARPFTSFEDAAAEASISRLYGGIHFRPAVEQGVWQGVEVGRCCIRRLGIKPLPGARQEGARQAG